MYVVGYKSLSMISYIISKAIYQKGFTQTVFKELSSRLYKEV